MDSQFFGGLESGILRITESCVPALFWGLASFGRGDISYLFAILFYELARFVGVVSARIVWPPVGFWSGLNILVTCPLGRLLRWMRILKTKLLSRMRRKKGHGGGSPFLVLASWYPPYAPVLFSPVWGGVQRRYGSRVRLFAWVALGVFPRIVNVLRPPILRYHSIAPPLLRGRLALS